MEVKYQGGKLILHDDYIEVKATGLLEKGTQKLGTIAKSIKLEEIAGLGWKEPSMMSNGFLQLAPFDTHGSSFVCQTVGDTFRDGAKNVFMFTKGQRQGMNDLKTKIESYIAEFGSGPRSKSAGKVDNATQVKALTELLEAGLISKEVYKKQIAEID